jgi:hypothetical protein
MNVYEYFKMRSFKLFGFEKRDDYGTDYYFSFLKTSKYTFLQVSLSICEIPSRPYLQITMGENKLFGVFCYFWRIGADFDILAKTWRV